MPARIHVLFASLALLTGCAAPPTEGNVSGGGVEDAGATLWETDAGGKIHLNELNGRVRIMAMFYSSCQGVCAITRQDLEQIEASLAPGVRARVKFVLVTLDPPRDTAATLRAYRHAWGLAADRWVLLRGEEAATKQLAARLGVGSGRDGAGRFIHSSELVVLDPQGRIIHRHHGQHADLPGIAREIATAVAAQPGFAE